MTPTEGIAALLVAAGVGAQAPTTPWPIYQGQLGAVAQAIMVKEAGGRGSEVKIAIDYPSIQILVRGTKDGYITARQKVENVFNALQAIPSNPVEYPDLTSCVAVGGTNFVGYDTDERPVWSVNFNLILSKAPVGFRDQ